MSQQLPEAAAELPGHRLPWNSGWSSSGNFGTAFRILWMSCQFPNGTARNWNVDWPLLMPIRTLQSRGNKSRGDFAKIFLHEIRGWFEQRAPQL